MKKYIGIPLLVTLMVLVGMMLGGRGENIASAQTTIDELKITRVNDIEVFNLYDINSIAIDNSVYPDYETKIYKFTLEQDGFVKLLLTADNMTKLTYAKAKSSEQDPAVSATVYRDDKLLFNVIPTITAKGSVNATGINGETKAKVALDKGTYYVAIKTDKHLQGATTTYVRGQAGIILYYQPITSDELYRPSSVGYENPVKADEAFQGLLTVANPKDYYVFEIDERSLVNIMYMYESSNKAKFVLYGEDRAAKLTKQFNGNNVKNQEELLLDAGRYYMSLETLATGDGGRTSIEINYIPYPLKVKQVNKTKNSYIRVDTIEAPKEVRYLRGKLTQRDINNTNWRTAELITDKLQFGINKSGNYSVRVVDDKGNMFIESVRVTTCDSTAPDKPKIKSYVVGSYEVTGTAEKNSIVTVLYGNRPYICDADSKGDYSCVLATRLATGAKVEVCATDISGNVSKSAVVAVK